MEVDGQCKCGLEGDGTIGTGDAKPGCVEATRQIHQPNLEVGKDEKEEEANFSQMYYLCFCILYFLVDLFQGVVVNPEELEWFGYGRHRGGG